jgi:hypothetical protein
LIVVLEPAKCKFKIEGTGVCLSAEGETVDYDENEEEIDTSELTCTLPEYREVNLIYGVWITGIVNLTLFLMMILHYIRCGCCIKKIGRGMVGYYTLLIGAMIWAQLIFF